jgi:hypothetical protein
MTMGRGFRIRSASRINGDMLELIIEVQTDEFWQAR